jgi:CYTH domain-containing protein
MLAGVPTFEIERKYLLAERPDPGCDLLRGAQVFSIEQTYLRSVDEDVERRVRRREHDGEVSFLYTEKRPTGQGSAVREEAERTLSAEEYERLLAEADPSCAPIVKERRVFAYGSHIFELDSYADRELHVLEVELGDADVHVSLPPELRIAREVTGEAEFRNRSLAATPSGTSGRRRGS